MFSLLKKKNKKKFQFTRKISPNAVEFVDLVVCNGPNLSCGYNKVKYRASWNVRKRETWNWARRAKKGSSGRGTKDPAGRRCRGQAQPFCWSYGQGHVCVLLAWTSTPGAIQWEHSPIEPSKSIQTSWPAEEIIPNVWAKPRSPFKASSINCS